MYIQTVESIGSQAKTTRNLVEDKAIYPGKVLLDEIVTTTQSLPDKFINLLQAQIIKPVVKANKKASSTANTLYPDIVDFIGKKIAFINDIYHQALSEFANQVKKSPFWDGKNKLKVSY